MSRMLELFMAFAVFVSLMAIPQETYAAANAKASGKYKITVHNINSNTVLKKGTKIKIAYTATKTKGGVTTGAKVKFKSSKKKVASVSKSGVIKAKKKGTTYITVYCKAKPGKKKKIKIRVGTPVSSISISGTRYLRVGRSNTLKAQPNSSATNKNVSWWSDNPAVATVNNNGKIEGISSGVATVYAQAKDGSGVYGTRKVYVHQYYSDEAKWIAHRGLHTSATENTAGAFDAAGQDGGFWGCECDIWETRTVSPSMPELPGLPDEGAVDPEAADSNTEGEQPADEPGTDAGQNQNTVQEEVPDMAGIMAAVEEWPPAYSMDVLKKSSEVVSVWEKYTELTKDLTEDQLKQIHKVMINDTGEDLLEKLYNVYKWVKEYESIDLVINHDSTFAEIWGNGNSVRSMSADEIRTQLPGVCFLAEYLDICKMHNMVPVIEFKDPSMSSAAINKALDMVDERGLLDQAYLISFYDRVLADAKAQATDKLGHEPITYYLISDDGASGINLAMARGYTGVSLSKSIIDSDLYNSAKSYGLGVGTWTYKNQISDDEKLYKHMFSYGWQLDFVTVDYRIFK